MSKEAVSTLSPMQQELLSRADSIFAAIGETVSKASDAAVSAGTALAKEIPDFAYQYIAFGRAYNTGVILISLFLIFIWYKWFLRIGMYNTKNLPDQRYGVWSDARIIQTIIGLAAGVAGLTTFFSNIKDMILVWVAPKVWLILELANLVRRVKG